MRVNILSHTSQIINHYAIEIGPKQYYYREYLDQDGKFVEDELIDEEDKLVPTSTGTLEHIRNMINNQK